MSDLFLDQAGCEHLHRDLRTLVQLAPLLDDLLEPTVPASGVNAGRGVSVRGPRAPVRIRPLDVKADALDCLRGWCANLRADLGGPAPPGRGLAVLAAWLSARMPDVAGRPWAPDCAEEVGRHARVIADLVDPPPGAPATPRRVFAPPPGAPAAPPAAAVPGLDRGTARQVAEAMAVLGTPVSHTTIRAWVRAGFIDAETRADGAQLVWLAQVWAHARGGTRPGASGDAG